MLLTGTSVGLDDEALRTRLEAGVSTSPTVKLIGPVEVSWLVVWSGMSEMTGGELLVGVTVRTKLSLAVSEPSLTVAVIVAEPNWLLAGVTEIVRLAPEPPKTMPLLGTSAGLDEELLRTRLEAAVSASPTVNPIGSADPPWTIVWSGMSEIVGGELPAPPSTMLPIGTSSTRSLSKITFGPEELGPT